MIGFRHATIQDADFAALHQRADDAHGWTQQRLRRALLESEIAWAGTIDGDVAALFGMADESRGLERRGVCWLATTTVMQRDPLQFARLSRPVWDDLRSGWDQVRGGYPASERCAGAWLRKLGFTLGEQIQGLQTFSWRAVDVHRT